MTVPVQKTASARPAIRAVGPERARPVLGAMASVVALAVSTKVAGVRAEEALRVRAALDHAIARGVRARPRESAHVGTRIGRMLRAVQILQALHVSKTRGTRRGNRLARAHEIGKRRGRRRRRRRDRRGIAEQSHSAVFAVGTDWARLERRSRPAVIALAVPTKVASVRAEDAGRVGGALPATSFRVPVAVGFDSALIVLHALAKVETNAVDVCDALAQAPGRYARAFHRVDHVTLSPRDRALRLAHSDSTGRVGLRRTRAGGRTPPTGGNASEKKWRPRSWWRCCYSDSSSRAQITSTDAAPTKRESTAVLSCRRSRLSGSRLGRTNAGTHVAPPSPLGAGVAVFVKNGSLCA